MHRIFIVFAVTATLMVLVFAGARWYADDSALPRYCADPAGVLSRVERILTQNRPVGSQNKKPFVVAAKLIFLIPQENDETIDSYVIRLRQHLGEVCRQRQT